MQLKLTQSPSRPNVKDDESVPPLFSENYHHTELANEEISMPGDQRPSPGPRANPMLVSSLCSPPAHSSLPPHLARGATSNQARVTHSPTSSLSSPPHTAHTPPSPTIAFLGHRSPSPGANAAVAEASVAANANAESSTSTVRKRRREESEQPQTPVLASDELDERTKIWKRATGFRKDLTADKLTQPEAPTRKKNPSATFTRRTVTPAAMTAAPNVLTKPPTSYASQNSGSGESANEDEDELYDAADVGTSGRAVGASGTNRKLGHSNDEAAGAAADIDSEEAARLEKKRRQNTQAARRSRIRKAEEVQKLQSRVAELEAEVMAGQHRLAQAKRDAARLDVLHRNEVEFTGILKNSIVNLVGDHKGGEAIGQATQRWRAITLPASPSAASMPPLHGEQTPEMDYELEVKSGARAGS